MITEIVTFPLPEGLTRAQLIANFEKTAPVWQSNPDLLRKYYLYDPDRRIAGGVYLWKERAHAAHWHGPAFQAKVKETYGVEPSFQYFETPIVVEPRTT